VSGQITGNTLALARVNCGRRQTILHWITAQLSPSKPGVQGGATL